MKCQELVNEKGDEVNSGCRGLTVEESKRFIDEKLNGEFSGKECLKELLLKYNEIIELRGVPLKKVFVNYFRI